MHIGTSAKLDTFLPIFIKVKGRHKEKVSPKDSNEGTCDEAVLQAPKLPQVRVNMTVLDGTRDLGKEHNVIYLEPKVIFSHSLKCACLRTSTNKKKEQIRKQDLMPVCAKSGALHT